MRMLLYVDDLDRLGTKDEKAVEVHLGHTRTQGRFQIYSDQSVRSGLSRTMAVNPWAAAGARPDLHAAR